jgi:hypothetical protein
MLDGWYQCWTIIFFIKKKLVEKEIVSFGSFKSFEEWISVLE